jgi:hypothetical protein
MRERGWRRFVQVVTSRKCVAPMELLVAAAAPCASPTFWPAICFAHCAAGNQEVEIA